MGNMHDRDGEIDTTEPHGDVLEALEAQWEEYASHMQQASAAHDDAPGFRLDLSTMRGDLTQNSDSESYTSKISSESPMKTPPESPASHHGEATQEAELTPSLSTDPGASPVTRPSSALDEPSNHLSVPRNSLSISHRSSLDINLSFQSPSAPPEPVIPGEDPWITFLNAELTSTFSLGEHHTNRMLLILREYFGVPSPTQEYAQRVADALQRVSDEYLLCASPWNYLEHDQDLEAFLWLVWGALIEVVLRMGASEDQNRVVLLVRKLLKAKARTKLEITGKHGQTWTGSEIPSFRSIWPSLYVGFGPGPGPSGPLEARPEEWITLFSFLGRLTAAGMTDSWELEVWALDDCLGEETWSNRSPSRESECLVLAACEFVRHAAEKIATDGAKSTGWARAFARAKWKHWLDRFADLADLFDGGPGPVQWAAWFAGEYMVEVRVKTGFV